MRRPPLLLATLAVAGAGLLGTACDGPGSTPMPGPVTVPAVPVAPPTAPAGPATPLPDADDDGSVGPPPAEDADDADDGPDDDLPGDLPDDAVGGDDG